MARGNFITYVDVTQLVHWSGRLTGIPRVMHELAVRFATQPDVRFVSWVQERGELCEVDFMRTMADRKQGVQYAKPGRTVSAQVRGASAPRRTSRTLQRICHYAKAGVKRMLRSYPGLAHRLEQRVHALHFDNMVPAALREGDALFIPWGEWWDDAFTNYVNKQEQAGVNVVQIIHDIATTTQPQFYEKVAASPKAYNAAVLPHAALVLAVSANTKRELVEWLTSSSLPVPHVEVIRNGDAVTISDPTKPADEHFAGARLKGNDFILTVGTIEAKKNHALLYYVYKLASAQSITLPKLVVVGRRGWGTDDIYRIMTSDPALRDQFVFLHNASDEELAWLYDHCMFTIQPSFHEGWGIPIAESLARGVPCACSNTSSMVEIAEGIVDHFSPASTDECLAAITKWLNPKELRIARERTKRYQPTSWDDTFAQVTKYMEEL